MAEFQDFTLEETLLFGNTIAEPLSDFPQVFRSVITDMTFTLAQSTPAVWFSDYIAGLAGLVGSERLEFRTKMVGRLKDKEVVIKLNLCDWTEDVIDEFGTDSGLALRRRVSDELRLESDSIGNCDRWLAFFAWVIYRRDTLAAGNAPQGWADYEKDTPYDIAKNSGVNSFLGWIDNRMLENLKSLEQDDGDEPGDNPLGEDLNTHDGAVAAAV